MSDSGCAYTGKGFPEEWCTARFRETECGEETTSVNQRVDGIIPAVSYIASPFISFTHVASGVTQGVI